ncbi:hypothetical protein B9Z55_015047 [Caenorhabditis nigoni]|uniref:SUN domain-containing protein n=2 Tax=Caenorhabditis nigoni TaxID=1611254 RepID=A0A2G5U8D2_9PELO|nr:hypothetical protein B9Z55_015047 [Caenorhabditis nigoni]
MVRRADIFVLKNQAVNHVNLAFDLLICCFPSLFFTSFLSATNGNYQMVNSKFGIMESKKESLASQKPSQDTSQFESTKPLEQSVADELKIIKFPTQKSADDMEPIFLHNSQSTSKTENSPLKIPIQNKLFRFNAADFLKGASVDRSLSSRSSLKPEIGYDQTNLVLLDRPQPPEDKAWCSNAEHPVLTINLAKSIKPISVSYQHSKWYGTIPNGAPKTYDVVGCLDCNGEDWEPLVSNCKYIQYISKGTEQMCNISAHREFPIRKVQFRFRENHGDTKTTCVHLVRVYGETKTPSKIEEKSLESEERCADLKWYYHNSYFRYNWHLAYPQLLYYLYLWDISVFWPDV